MPASGTKSFRIAVLGAGNIGTALARGLVRSGRFLPGQIALTRRNPRPLDGLRKEGFDVGSDNVRAVANSDFIIVAVEPRQIKSLLQEVRPGLKPARHVLASVVSGVGLQDIAKLTGGKTPVLRAMPNIAAAIGESITCVAYGKNRPRPETAAAVSRVFEAVGPVLEIDEEQMIAATVIGACGIAFFLRAIRAASQGGIEVGFHSQDALRIAAQTARGAATLLLQSQDHPESEIDRVTTPRGCTISGLNQMEHEGFSSAMIKGILTSRDKASTLFKIDG
ncbi:MAG: pyrroline-5-carboxylate reductase [bacterium]|nr:pyrroline-5-carboxylate reductase [bacterium]